MNDNTKYKKMIRHSTEDDGNSTPSKKQKVSKMIGFFPMKPINKFSQGFPYFRQPVEFGFFSLDGTRAFHNDASQLKAYIPPRIQFDLDYDLRDGYGTHIEKDDDIKERLTHLLTWIKRNKAKFRANDQDPVGKIKK